jgi:hypothetical protein
VADRNREIAEIDGRLQAARAELATVQDQLAAVRADLATRVRPSGVLPSEAPGRAPAPTEGATGAPGGTLPVPAEESAPPATGAP